MRAVEFVQTLPQWNGKDIMTYGGSQGGLQAVAAAALSDKVTQCKVNVPWCCDLGGQIAKNRIPGWRPEWKLGLGYFDTVNMVKRIKCPIEITGGLGDTCCPPSGICILYNNAPNAKKLTLIQGGEHCTQPARAIHHHFEENWQEVFPTYELTQSDFSGLYGVNDKGIFHIRAAENCTATGKKICCRLIRNGIEEIYRQVFSPDQVPDIPFEFQEAGDWICLELNVLDEHGVMIKHQKSQHIGAMCVPHILSNSTPDGPEFDAFWQAQKDELAKVPVNVQIIKERIQEGFKISDIRVDCAANRPVSGILSIPQGAERGTLPAIISYHGAGVRSAYADPIPGAIRLDVNPHGIENGREVQYYAEMAKQINEGGNYILRDFHDPVKYTIRSLILRALRALDYIKTLPEWNGRDLWVMGGSQGGMLAIAATALDSAVNTCICAVPGWCDLCGFSRNRFASEINHMFAAENKALSQALHHTALLYECGNFVRRIGNVPIHFTAGGSDFSCTPQSVYCVYNQANPDYRKMSFLPMADHHEGHIHRQLVIDLLKARSL